MRVFVARLTIYAPYPIKSEHVIKASSAATASARAIRSALAAKQDGDFVINKRKVDSYSLEIRAVNTRS